MRNAQLASVWPVALCFLLLSGLAAGVARAALMEVEYRTHP